MEESIHVAFDETNLLDPRKDIIDDVVEALENTHINDKEKEQKKEKESEKETPQQEQTRTNDLPSSKRVEDL